MKPNEKKIIEDTVVYYLLTIERGSSDMEKELETALESAYIAEDVDKAIEHLLKIDIEQNALPEEYRKLLARRLNFHLKKLSPRQRDYVKKTVAHYFDQRNQRGGGGLGLGIQAWLANPVNVGIAIGSSALFFIVSIAILLFVTRKKKPKNYDYLYAPSDATRPRGREPVSTGVRPSMFRDSSPQEIQKEAIARSLEFACDQCKKYRQRKPDDPKGLVFCRQCNTLRAKLLQSQSIQKEWIASSGYQQAPEASLRSSVRAPEAPPTQYERMPARAPKQVAARAYQQQPPIVGSYQSAINPLWNPEPASTPPTPYGQAPKGKWEKFK